jgi:hypothetical protein
MKLTNQMRIDGLPQRRPLLGWLFACDVAPGRLMGVG